MKVWIPDSLLSYEQELLGELLAKRGCHPLFGEPDPGVEAILTGGPPLGAKEVGALPRLRKVIRFARGRFDLAGEQEALAARGIEYRKVSGGSAASTAEHALMLMLALLRRLPEAGGLAAEGSWPQRHLAELGIRDLSEVTVGLVGFGRVGRRLADLLAAFGPRILYWKPRRLPRSEERALGVEWATLEDLLASSDVISLQARAPASNGPVLNREHLGRLRPGAILVNVGDGRHVDLEALSRALDEGRLTAGLDVFPEEPPAALELSAARSRLLLTPHVAGRSRAAARELFTRACAELSRSSELRPPARDVPAAFDQQIGPVLRLLLDRVREDNLFPECRVRLSRRLEAELPGLVRALAGLGADVAEASGDHRPSVRVEAPAGVLDLLMDPAAGDPGEAAGGAFAIGRVPAVRFLLERWRLDYAIWQELLPHQARGSLPGRLLTVEGYGPRGRLLAWRARELGLRVLVLEPRSLPRLEAISDGFETGRGTARGGLVVRTGESGGEEDPVFSTPSRIPPGLADELSAAALATLAVWLRGEQDLAVACDRWLMETLLEARDPDHVPSRFFRASDRR